MSRTVLFLTDDANSARVSIVSLSALLYCSERSGSRIMIQNDGDFGTGLIGRAPKYANVCEYNKY